MSRSTPNPPVGPGAVLSGLLLGLWLWVCDGWLKVLARLGACEPPKPLQEVVVGLWSIPDTCAAVPLVRGTELRPTPRVGATPWDLPLPASVGEIWGLTLLAGGTVAGIVVLRWSRRTRGDALALGTLWGGLAIHAVPRLAGPRLSFAELTLGRTSIGLGDVAIAWALVWLAWRAAAELRA